jgi:uncharacterized protein involved in tolerance to divalent cations
MSKQYKKINRDKEVVELMKDINMKLDHIIERLKHMYNYLNTVNSLRNARN